MRVIRHLVSVMNQNNRHLDIADAKKASKVTIIFLFLG